MAPARPGQLQRLVRERRITKALNSELDKAKVLETIVDKGVELIKAERGFLILVQDGVLDFKVARNRDKTEIENPSQLISRSVLDGVTETGEPVLTTDAQTALSGSMSITALEVRSLICVPLRLKERNLGALYVDSKFTEAQFNEESQNLVHAFADQAAIAIENARLFDEVAGSREAEKSVRQMFRKYVPADVVREVLKIKDGGRLSSKLTATVLFSDIRGFTSISEKIPPRTWSASSTTTCSAWSRSSSTRAGSSTSSSVTPSWRSSVRPCRSRTMPRAPSGRRCA